MYSAAMRRWALVAAIVTVATPVAAAAGSPVASPARSVMHHHADGGSNGRTTPRRSVPQRLAAVIAKAPNVAAAEQVWLRRQAHTALARFSAGPDAPAAPTSVSAPLDLFPAALVPAGDLTGTGRKVVLETRLRISHHFLTSSLSARAARTGRALWTRRGPTADQEVLPLGFSAIGTPAERGLLVVQLSTQTLSKNSFRMSETVAAWSGKTGKTIWTSAPVTGTESFTRTTMSATNLPALADAFHAIAGRPLDALITTSTFTKLPDDGRPSTPSPASATAVLIAGRDGASTSPYPALSSSVAPPNIEVMSDLDGDGLDDVLAITPGKPGTMVAEHGDTGAAIWSVGQQLPDVGQAVPVGRLGGGRIGDFVIEANRLSLIRGRDGKVLWTRHTFDDVIPVGRVGHHRAPAVALFGQRLSETEFSTGKVRESSAVDIRAITATNRVVWDRRIAARIHFHGLAGQPRFKTNVEPVGDVQPDGTTDFAVRVSIRNSGKQAHRSGLVSGRDGTVHRGLVGSPADGSLVRGGRGNDLLRAGISTRGIVLSGFDGATGVRIVHRLVKTPRHSHLAFTTGLRATGHPCSDIEAGALYPGRHVVLDLLSGSGRRLWSLHYGRSQLTAGRVIRYKAPKHFCAK